MAARENKKNSYRIRAKIPLIMRGVAVFGLIVTILFIGVGFYRGSSYAEFRLKPQHAQLSDNVVGIVNGYERRETENGILKYYIKADKATTFSDEHQELENVVLEVFDKSGFVDLKKIVEDGGEESDESDESEGSADEKSDKKQSDKVTAKKAIYIPEKGKDNFTIYFVGDVNVETRNKLKVKSEQMVYSKKTEIAESEVLVTFERENISGKSLGAIVNIKKRTLELLKDVEIVADGKKDTELADSNIRRVKIKTGHALVEQGPETIKADGGVDIALTPKSHVNGRLTQPTDIKSAKATAYFKEKKIKKFDLEGNVYIYQKATKAKPSWTKTWAKRAIVAIDGEPTKFELFDNAKIQTTASDRKLTTITGNYVLYDQIAGRVLVKGKGNVVQGSDLIRGDVLNADLFPDKKVRYARATGNAFLRQKKSDRTTEVTAPELNATFNANRELHKANAQGSSTVVVLPSKAKEYTKLKLTAPNAINLDFRSDGTLRTMNTQGRTTIKLNAPNNSPDAANKTLTADKVNTILRPNGKELENATAIGNAVLVVEPLRKAPENYQSTIKAPRFDCDFYDQNNARQCVAQTGTKTVRIPTLPTKSRKKQTLIALTLTTIFNPDTQGVQRFDAIGKAKFREGDRNGIARTITYTANDEVVRLRGGDPTLWNADARVRAREIDWNTKRKHSSYRGKVRTTYYSQKRTGGATPFGSPNSPVFFTSNTADFDHEAETAIFIGRARAWQGNNYVRANKLFLDQKQGRFSAEGNVQSVLYEADRTVGGKKTKTTVYASSKKMLYQRLKNLLRYEENVDIRQGSDRLRGEIANIFLDKKGELIRTIMERNVVITQPNRRATGDYAKYTAATEVVILRGNPATVRDSENGSSSGREMTVYLKTNRMVGKGRTKKNSTGRIRTVYKIKDGKLN